MASTPSRSACIQREWPALHAALSAIQTLRPGKPTLQLGFPYVDVLKQPQVVFHGGELFQPQSLAEVEAALDQLQPAAVIVELPSNPAAALHGSAGGLASWPAAEAFR